MKGRSQKMRNLKMKKKCVYSGKFIGNRPVILEEYAMDYVKQQGYSVGIVAFKIYIYIFAVLFLLIPFSSAIIDNPNLPKIISEENIDCCSDGNQTFNQSLADSLYWRLDASNDPPTADWNMGNRMFQWLINGGSNGLFWTINGVEAYLINYNLGRMIFISKNGVQPAFVSENSTLYPLVLQVDGNITANNICYSNGSNCQSTGGGTGVNETFANQTYLRLDTNNDPLTDDLQTAKATSDEFGIGHIINNTGGNSMWKLYATAGVSPLLPPTGGLGVEYLAIAEMSTGIIKYAIDRVTGYQYFFSDVYVNQTLIAQTLNSSTIVNENLSRYFTAIDNRATGGYTINSGGAPAFGLMQFNQTTVNSSFVFRNGASNFTILKSGVYYLSTDITVTGDGLGGAGAIGSLNCKLGRNVAGTSLQGGSRGSLVHEDVPYPQYLHIELQTFLAFNDNVSVYCLIGDGGTAVWGNTLRQSQVTINYLREVL